MQTEDGNTLLCSVGRFPGNDPGGKRKLFKMNGEKKRDERLIARMAETSLTGLRARHSPASGSFCRLPQTSFPKRFRPPSS